MKQNIKAEEAKSEADKKPYPKPASLSDVPLWLITSFALLLVSLVSLIYVFLKRRGAKSQSSQSVRTESIPTQELRLEQDTSVPALPIANIEQPEKKQNFAVRWFEALNNWSLPDQMPEQMKKIAGPFLALVVAYIAQGIFDSITNEGLFSTSEVLTRTPEATRLWLGAAVYLVAMLIWFFTAPSIQSIGTTLKRSVPLDSQQPRYHPIRFILLVASIVTYFVSILMYVTSGESGIVRGLWGAGVICFILSQIPSIWSHTNPHPEAEESPRFRWQNWLVLALILVVGFWLRYYKIATIPDDLHGDMASHGQVARDFLLGIRHDIFGFGWAATPTMGFLAAFLTMAVFGNNIFGLQMAAVLGGTFSLLAIYLLIWRLFDSHRLATLTTALVAINIAHIHFSRIFNMEPWPLGNFAIFLLIDGLKSRRSTSLGLAGIFGGFSLIMYTSGRVLPFMIIVFLAYVFFFHRSWIRQNIFGLVLMAAGVLVALGPAVPFFLKDLDAFASRGREVFIFSPGVLDHLLNKYNTSSAFVVLLTQIKLTLLMFNQATDTSSQFGFPHPMFSTLISPLILLGFVFVLRRWKDAGMTFVLIWLGLIAVIGSILTIDAPFWPRLVGIVPAAALLIAVAFDQILELGRKTFGTKAGHFVAVLITIFLAVVGYLNWNQYYLAVKESASPSTMTGRYIGRLPLDVTACSITSGPPLTVRETYFLAWPHKLVDIKPDAPDSELDTCTGSSIVWVISPENTNRLDAIRARWPNGIVQEHYFPQFSYTLTFYLIGVNPPVAYQPDANAVSNQFLWLLNEIKSIFPIFLYGILILLFLWVLFLAISYWWQEKSKSDISVVQTPRQPDRVSVSSWDWFNEGYAGLNKWYNEVIGFKLPKDSSKLIAPTVLSLAAVGLAYFAQTFLDQRKSDGLHLPVEWLSISSEGLLLGVACFIFLIAALLWTFTIKDRENTPSVKQGMAPQGNKLYQPMMGSPIQIVGIFLTISSMFFYYLLGETSMVRWLWLAGLIVFLASLLVKKQSGVVGVREESPAFRWFHVLILLSLLVVAFFLRVYRLYDIPLDLSTDMASVGINARKYLLGTEQLIFGTGWYFMPRFSFMPYVAGMAVAGNNLFGLYFATVVMGTFNIFGIYLFIWRLFDRHRLALLTAVLVTINPAHINLSRITSYMDPWFFGFFGLFFFVDGLKGRRWASLALAGLFTGFTLVSYPAGRAIIPLIAIGLVCVWLFNRKWITDNYGGLGWAAVGLLVTLGPNLVYFITNWSVYMQRSAQVIIFNPGNVYHLQHTYNVDSIWMIIWEQTKRSVLLFNYYTDKSAQFSYPHPMFNSLVSPLIFLGFGMSLYRWRKTEYLFTLSSLLFILVTGSILTIDAPTWVRLVGMIPFAALLIALALDELVNILERISMKPFVPFLLLGMTMFLIALTVVDFSTYLRDVGNENIVRPEVHVARYLDTLPDNIDACGLTDEYLVSQEEILFMGWPRSITVVPADSAVLTPDLCPGKNVVWIVSPALQNRLAEIQLQWPGGIVEEHYTENGWHVFTSYLVSNKSAP